jgi:hypothetical protein
MTPETQAWLDQFPADVRDDPGFSVVLDSKWWALTDETRAEIVGIVRYAQRLRAANRASRRAHL